MTSAPVVDLNTAPDVREDESVATIAEQVPCITIIDRPVAPVRALKGEPITGKVSLMMLAGEEFGRIHELDALRIDEGRLHGISTESVPMGSIVTIGWQDPSRAACRGVVAFAIPASGGWRIMVELDSKLAA